jgi:hypothetical protein
MHAEKVELRKILDTALGAAEKAAGTAIRGH